MTKKYASVLDLLSDSKDKNILEIRDAVEEEINAHQISTILSVFRTKAGYSQAQIAEKIGISVEKIDFIESMRDDEMTVNYLFMYIQSMGYAFYTVREGQSIADSINIHIAQIRNMLGELAKIPKGDEAISKASLKFLSDTLENFSKMIGDAYGKIASEVKTKDAVSIVNFFEGSPEEFEKKSAAPESTLP